MSRETLLDWIVKRLQMANTDQLETVWGFIQHYIEPRKEAGN